MSSLLRRIEIRIMKRAGYTRESWIVDRYGKPETVRRDGEITDADDTPIGRDWPKHIPARARPPHNAKPAARKHITPRALRRSKRSQQWLERRAKARGES